MKRLGYILFVVCAFSTGLKAQSTTTIRPTADGSVKQWTNNTGGACTSNACFSQVNETTGVTNCTGSTVVKGDGVLNIASATSGLIEQYTMTLGIANGNVIDSIVVHACEKRLAGTNATGNLRIVLNGATTNCASNQSVTSAYQDLSCTFSGLSATVGGGTTLEIGNRTTTAQGIDMDTISAVVTYHNAVTGGPAASEHTSPAVAASKQHPVAEAQGFTTSPAASTSHSPTNHTFSPAASVHSDPPCCALTDFPLNATIHVGPGVSVQRTTGGGSIAQGLHTSPAVTGVRSARASDAAAFKTDAPCCALTDSPLAASFHTSPVVTVQRGSSGAASVGTGISITNGLSVKAVGSLARSGAVSTHFDPPCCVVTNSPLTASIHTSPAVTGTAHSNRNGIVTQGETTTPACAACRGIYFQSASVHFSMNVTAAPNKGGAIAVGFTSAASAATQRGLHAGSGVGFTTAPAVAEASAHFAPVTSGFATSASDSAGGPGSHTVNPNQAFHTATLAQESAQTSSSPYQSAHFGAVPATTRGLNVNVAAGFTTSAQGVGFTIPKNQKSPVVVVN